jgi:ubiquinone/menaquinone biosynthesis C-methylase UbiE
MTFTDAKHRFSDRVADYVRYRSGYPPAVLDLLHSECGLRPGHVIADIGSGTGFLSELFLKNGNRVFGVEPNEAMRQAGEEYLASYHGFTSVNGSAEATTLDDASADFVSAAQAFHWFEPVAARREFVRILKPGGWVVVIWNERLVDTTPLMREYEALLRKFGNDYTQVTASYPWPGQMRAFFAGNLYSEHGLPNPEEFDFAGMSGRLRSSSYVPVEGHPRFAPMIAELDRIFRAHEQNGRVRMDYVTRLYFGQLDVDPGFGGITQYRDQA